MIPASTPQSTILERLAQGEVLISDGASGTYLQQHGLEPGGCPEALNEAQPEIVKGMAAAFFEAGSDLVSTNSFGGSKFVLKNYGLAGRVRELNRLAAKHARGEAPAGCFVVGSLGPSGEFLEPLGSVSEDEMVEAFHEQIEALVEGGVDAVLIETMTALEEATLAVRTAREFSGLPVFCSMTFDKGPRGYFTMMGVTPTQAVAGLRDAGADVVGTNCGSGIVDVIAVFREMREADDGHLLVQSNAGIPIFQGGELVYPDSPEIMAEHYQTLLKEGVAIVGGCCGTGPGHIRSLAALAGRNQARTKR
ncbi:MAG: homocysteine S-methyltransferase family protein [bacterium]